MDEAVQKPAEDDTVLYGCVQNVWLWSRVRLRVGWIKQIRGISERRPRTKGVSLIINLVYHGDMKADRDGSWLSIQSALFYQGNFVPRG